MSETVVEIAGKVTVVDMRWEGIGAPGVPGAPGEPGVPGAPGEGVPIGGDAGQLLVKSSSADFDSEWKSVTTDDIPAGIGPLPVSITGNAATADAATNADTASVAEVVRHSLSVSDDLTGGPFDGAADVELGVNASSGVVVGGIPRRDAAGKLAGDIAGNAATAGHATTAGSADTAGYATAAGSALSAANATSADSATTAINATTADKTKRKLTFSSDLGGSSFDGSADVTLGVNASASVVANAIPRRDNNGSIAGNITGSSAAATTALSAGKFSSTKVIEAVYGASNASMGPANVYGFGSGDFSGNFNLALRLSGLPGLIAIGPQSIESVPSQVISNCPNGIGNNPGENNIIVGSVSSSRRMYGTSTEVPTIELRIKPSTSSTSNLNYLRVLVLINNKIIKIEFLLQIAGGQYGEISAVFARSDAPLPPGLTVRLIPRLSKVVSSITMNSYGLAFNVDDGVEIDVICEESACVQTSGYGVGVFINSTGTQFIGSSVSWIPIGNTPRGHGALIDIEFAGARKTLVVGNGTDVDFVFTHNQNNINTIVQCRSVAGADVPFTVLARDAFSVTVRFATAPAASAAVIMVM